MPVAESLPRVCAIIVTFNRSSFVRAVLKALADQRAPAHLAVIVVDNASTDGAAQAITDEWGPSAIYRNPAIRDGEHAFSPARSDDQPHTAFARLVLIQNAHNLGGAGGFNTGLTAVAAGLSGWDKPDFVWLVDDDVDLPPDALANLLSAAISDPSVALVGSRTCDLSDRAVTIETTIYFDAAEGVMRDDAPPGHRLHDAHRAWLAQVGASRRVGPYTGLRDVDIVSACSMLARWSAVEKVGFWDKRFFIYCDDADWCLRMARAGFRIVLNLDALVFHTPWHHKLTPARAYYAQRNLLWLLQKNLPPSQARAAVRRRLRHLLREARRSIFARRHAHAEVLMRACADAAANRSGRVNLPAPERHPVSKLLATHAGRRPIAIIIADPRGLEHARALRARFPEVSFLEIIRNDIRGSHAPNSGVRRIVYSRRLRSKMRRQLALLLHPPAAAIIFDQISDFPLLRSPRTLHIDTSDPEHAALEPAGLRRTATLLCRWLATRARTCLWAARLPPFTPTDRYG